MDSANSTCTRWRDCADRVSQSPTWCGKSLHGQRLPCDRKQQNVDQDLLSSRALGVGSQQCKGVGHRRLTVLLVTWLKRGLRCHSSRRRFAAPLNSSVRSFQWLTTVQDAIDFLNPAHPTALSVDLLSMKAIGILKLVCLALSWRHA